MNNKSIMRIVAALVLVLAIVTASFFISPLWKQEAPTGGSQKQMAQAQRRESMTPTQQAIAREAASKDWKKIPLKMGLWAAFLTVAFVAMRRSRFNAKNRKWFYLASVVLFGVALGSDPSPMGTVKDAIALYATTGAVFPPRLIALGLFLLTVVLANKAICAWGCQLGTLQDLLFRFGRNDKDTRGQLKQVKIPFRISNIIRTAVFVSFVAVAFLMSVDIIGAVDPFKVFNPRQMTIAGIALFGVLAVSSLFIYRPWCHLACPFGLVGWLFERFSRVKIRVNESTCTKCMSCAKACPSDAMQAIVLKQKTLPDCFSCGTCIDVCPSKSIGFMTKKEHDKLGKN